MSLTRRLKWVDGGWMQRAITSSAVNKSRRPALARVGEGDGSEHFAELRGRVSLIETMQNGCIFRCSGGQRAVGR